MERNFKKMIKNYLPNIQIIVPSSINFFIKKTRQVLRRFPQIKLKTKGLKFNNLEMSPLRSQSLKKSLNKFPKAKKTDLIKE